MVSRWSSERGPSSFLMRLKTLSECRASPYIISLRLESFRPLRSR